MLTLIYKLAQADNTIVNNLDTQDQKLENLNAQLDVVKSDYVKMLNTTDTTSFFNLNNIYFWFLIAGLLLLLFGLLYLWVELRQQHDAAPVKTKSKRKELVSLNESEKPVEKAKPEPKKIEEPVLSTQDLIKLAKVREDIEELRKITKAKKIKVSKVK